MRTIRGVDLFCGAGGSSSGLVDTAAQLGRPLDLLAINHWQVAIATHQRNLPGVRHRCADVAAVDPRRTVPGGYLDILWASPECKQHSTARGGRPINDQKRADPWQIVRWLSELYVRAFIIENVPEFRAWGPVDAHGRAIRSKRGQTYAAFLETLKGLGYIVEARLLCAADYGDPTTRKRLFIVGRRDGKPIRWPAPSHGRPGNIEGLPAWRAAKEILDLALPSASIFGRKKPLARNTVARIFAGLRRFGGPALEPFLVTLRGTDLDHIRRSARPLHLPLPAVCASANHFGVVQPQFLLPQQSGGALRPTSQPAPTIATKGAIGLAEFIVGAGGPQRAGKPQSTDEPLGTALTRNHRGLVQPFLVPAHGERDGQTPRTHSIDDPLPVVACSNTHGVAQAFILPPLGVHARNGKANKPRSTDEPLQTVTAKRGGGHVVQPFLVHVNHGDNPKGSGRGNGGRVRSIEDPLSTVTASSRGLGVVQPLIAKYYSTGTVKPVSAPLDAVTTKDRFGLVQVDQAEDGVVLDIHFRMLQPHELAGAQGLEAFTFTGTKKEQVEQIGNANPRGLSRALCLAVLG